MKELGDKLPEGGAAVFVLVREATADKVVPGDLASSAAT